MILNRETNTSQVVKELERQIRTGKHIPGRKLPSTRELAKVYGVSQQVINSAMEILQQREILISRPRIGIYINTEKILPQERKLILLRCVPNTNSTKYPEKVLCLYDHELYADTHLQVHTVSKDMFLFKYELEKLSEQNPDCILIYNPELEHDDVAYIINHITSPVAFIGDFINGDYNDLNYNMIRENTRERGEAYINAAKKLDVSDACMIGGPADRDYIKQLIAGSKSQAEKNGIKFRYCPFQGIDSNDLEKCYQHRRKMLHSALSGNNIPEALILDDFTQIDQFVSILKEINLQPGRDIKIIETTELNRDAIFMRVNYSGFAAKAKELITEISENNKTILGKITLSGLIKRELIETRIYEL